MRKPSTGTNEASASTAMPMPSAAVGTNFCPGPAGSLGARPVGEGADPRDGAADDQAARLDVAAPEDGHRVALHHRARLDVEVGADDHRVADHRILGDGQVALEDVDHVDGA